MNNEYEKKEGELEAEKTKVISLTNIKEINGKITNELKESKQERDVLHKTF
jgi:hypothetical protein